MSAAAPAADYSHFARDLGEGLHELDLAVEPLGHAVDYAAVETGARGVDGIVGARLNLQRLRLTVRWRGTASPPPGLVEALEATGCRAHPLMGTRPDEEEHRQARWLLSCLAVAGFAAMNIMLLSVSVWAGNVTDITPETRDLFHWLSALIALPAAAYAGQPFFRSAIAGLRQRQMNMDVPISLGVLLALGMSVAETWHHAEHAYFDGAVMLLFFLLCGRYLDFAMRRRTRGVAENLAALKADLADRLDAEGVTVTVPVAALRPGDRVLVRAGGRCPADGTVEAGASCVDESLVTGETLPRAVAPGDPVHCGTHNMTGPLTVRVVAAGADTLLAEIERLLARASDGRSRYVRLADRAARLYAPVIHATAALSFAGWLAAGASLHDALIIAVSVLIITCPCALALAVPAVQMVAAGALFRRGILLNGADAIERFAEVDTIIFDKTGTLTLPRAGDVDAGRLSATARATAARLALSSHHPVALALSGGAQPRLPFGDADEVPQRGVRAVVAGMEARLGSPEFCGVEVPDGAGPEDDATLLAFSHGSDRGLIRVRQQVRADAAETVRALGEAGYRLRILSGDRPQAVESAGREVGIVNRLGGCRPKDKIDAVEQLQSVGHAVLMVGDGINDAPALAAARASLSPIAGSDLAQARADAVFLGDRLAPVAETLAISRRARRLMQENLWFAVAYNLLAVPLAVGGWVTPLIAAAAMSGSSIIVTLNALRAGRVGGIRPGPARDASPAAPSATPVLLAQVASP